MKRFLAVYIGTEAARAKSGWDNLDEKTRKEREAAGIKAWMEWGGDHAAAILDRYRVDFVFVGPLERQRYPAAGLAKLETWPRLERVFEQGEVVIYATPGAVHAEKSWLDPVRYDAGLSPSPESAPGGE